MFLLEREYAPYSKWLGTAFSRLPCGAELIPIVRQFVDRWPTGAIDQVRETLWFRGQRRPLLRLFD